MKLEEKALFGLPIVTEFGSFKPMTVYDYMDCAHLLQAMSFDKKRVLHEVRLAQEDKKKRESKEMTSALEKINEEMTLKDVLISFMPAYVGAYVEIIMRCRDFKLDEESDKSEEEQLVEKAEEFILNLEPEDFEKVRHILLAINAQSEQTAFLNPEMQRFKEKALNFKKSDNVDAPDASTMVTSVVTYTGINFKEVVNWNITQLQHMFQRVSMFLSYDAYIVFATVAGDKIDAVNWAENIKTEDDSNTSSSFAVEFDKFERDIGQALN